MNAVTDSVDELWREYARTKSQDVRNELVLKYVHLVKNIVYRMMPTYRKHVDFDDMLSFGTLGLIDAIDKFDINKEVKFETYATLRIKGEIIDQIRKQDWAPTSLRQKIKRVEEGFDEVEAKLGRSATDREVADYLSMDVGDVQKVLDDSYTFNVVCLDEIIVDKYKSEEYLGSSEDSPEQRYDMKEMIEILGDLIEKLPDKERLVITLYYYEEMTLKEIGLVLGVSESRVSQIHSKAVSTLKRRLNAG